MHAATKKVICFLGLLAIAACSQDSGGDGDGDGDGDNTADAGPDVDAVASTSCFDTPKTTAPDPLEIEGTVVTLFGSNPVDAATIEARQRTDDVVVVDQTTAGDGLFALSIDSGGAPWGGYFAITRTDMFTTYVYFSSSVSESFTGEEVPLADDGDIALMQTLLGLQIDTTQGMAVVQVFDCDGAPAAGARISFAPSGDVIYTDDNTPDLDATETDASGGALGLNLGVGESTVTIEIGDATVTTAIRAEAQSLVGLFVKP